MQKQEVKGRKGDIKNYILDVEIGHGASGVCYKAISKLDGSVCAIKKISINTIKVKQLSKLGQQLKNGTQVSRGVEVIETPEYYSILRFFY